MSLVPSDFTSIRIDSPLNLMQIKGKNPLKKPLNMQKNKRLYWSPRLRMLALPNGHEILFIRWTFWDLSNLNSLTSRWAPTSPTANRLKWALAHLKRAHSILDWQKNIMRGLRLWVVSCVASGSNQVDLSKDRVRVHCGPNHNLTLLPTSGSLVFAAHFTAERPQNAFLLGPPDACPPEGSGCG